MKSEAAVETVVEPVLVDDRKMVDIDYMQRKIGAYAGIGVDSKQSVIEELRAKFAEGWVLFATHYGGDSGNGITVLHILVKYA